MPTSSAILASLRLSGQLPDQRSGTRVTARPDEQFAPNRPILSLLALCIDMRSCRVGAGASTVPPEDLFGAGRLAQGRDDLNGTSGTNRLPAKTATTTIADAAGREGGAWQFDFLFLQLS